MSPFLLLGLFLPPFDHVIVVVAASTASFPSLSTVTLLIFPGLISNLAPNNLFLSWYFLSPFEF